MHHGSRGISGWLWQISQRNQLSPRKFYSSNHSKYYTGTEAREREREIGKQASDGVEATQQLDSSTIKRTGKGVDIYTL